MAKTQTPDYRYMDNAVTAALRLDIELSNAYWDLKRGKTKARLEKMVEVARAIRRDIEDLQNELAEAESDES